jgi:ssDNA-binding Zn-finger/Zn-ribbon topoisomerase 1
LLKNAAPELTSPEMTGEWEFRLREIEHGKLTREQFMSDVRSLTATIVKEAKDFSLDEHVADSEPFGECPKCQAALVERFKSFSCTNKKCDFAIWKTIAGRLLGRDEFEALLRDKQLGPLEGFRSKTGKRFSATVKLNAEWKTEFDFAVNDSGLKCEKCGKPLIIRSGRRGEFLACSGYPECKNAMSFKRDEAGKIVPIPREEGAEAAKMPDVDIKCEKCGKPMAIKMSRRGPFLACTGYPKCKNAQSLPEDLKAKLPPPKPKAPVALTDEKCDKCGAPMALRKGRFGEFLGCSAYPKCKNIKKIEKPKAPAPTPSSPSS